jgi:hypothetical protein
MLRGFAGKERGRETKLENSSLIFAEIAEEARLDWFLVIAP